MPRILNKMPMPIKDKAEEELMLSLLDIFAKFQKKIRSDRIKRGVRLRKQHSHV